jgi:ferrochelatase
MIKSKKTAIVLFNLGGPDKLESVKPFLFNLFNDRAIIGLPQPFRFFLAKLISTRREKKAQNIYAQIGGKSPLLEITNEQAHALESELSFFGDFKVFVAMRYWHPFAKETIEKILEYQPSEIILLPLYPQFSSSTSDSSIKDFTSKFSDKNVKIKTVCCYPNDEDFIHSHASLIKRTLTKIGDKTAAEFRLLFSAHGLPQKLIDAGDPYVFQVEKSTKAIIEQLEKNSEKLDFSICYQSKVGPLQWTSPSLEFEIKRCALDKKIPVIVPIAFVSDHSETLVELDIDYKNLAADLGIENYLRVPSLNLDGSFIKSLAGICKKLADENKNEIFCGKNPQRICPKNFGFCPNHNECEA